MHAHAVHMRAHDHISQTKKTEVKIIKQTQNSDQLQATFQMSVATKNLTRTVVKTPYSVIQTPHGVLNVQKNKFLRTQERG